MTCGKATYWNTDSLWTGKTCCFRIATCDTFHRRCEFPQLWRVWMMHAMSFCIRMAFWMWLTGIDGAFRPCAMRSPREAQNSSRLGWPRKQTPTTAFRRLTRNPDLPSQWFFVFRFYQSTIWIYLDMERLEYVLGSTFINTGNIFDMFMIDNYVIMQ